MAIASEHCAAVEMLASTASPAEIHALLTSYLLNIKRGPQAVRRMIVRDIHLSLELGAARRAANLLLVLQRFLAIYPRADENHCPCEAAAACPLWTERALCIGSDFSPFHDCRAPRATSLAGYSF